jgi:Domain of unknown function (DUF4142)
VRGQTPKLILSHNPPPIRGGWGFLLKMRGQAAPCGLQPPRGCASSNQSACSGSAKKAKEEKLGRIPRSAPSWALATFAFFGLDAAVSAQTETEAESKPKEAPTAAPAEPAMPKEKVRPAAQMNRFLGAAIPGANFIASASRMAAAFAHSGKVRKLAADLAKEQTALANSLVRWVNVSASVVTRQNPYAEGRSGEVKVQAPRLLPDQVSKLQELSNLRGQNFDSVYVESLKETLGQLQPLFREFSEGGGDEKLRAIAERELPKLKDTISALDAL